MPKIITLSEYQTKEGMKRKSLGITIPRNILKATGLEPGDHLEIEIKQVDPLIMALKKPKEVEF